MKTCSTSTKLNQLILFFVMVPIAATSQIETRRINPETFQNHVKFHTDFQVRKITLPSIDVAKVLKEDEEEVGRPPRFGKAIEVDFGLENGLWEKSASGRIWKLKIHSPGAFSLNLKFDRLHLPDSAELYLYNEERTMVMGPITSKINKPNKGLATDLIQGEVVVLEVFEPAGQLGKTDLHISRVVYGYKDMFGGEFSGPGFGYRRPNLCEIQHL